MKNIVFLLICTTALICFAFFNGCAGGGPQEELPGNGNPSQANWVENWLPVSRAEAHLLKTGRSLPVQAAYHPCRDCSDQIPPMAGLKT